MATKLTGLDYLRARMEYLGYNSMEEVAQAVGVNRGNLWRWFRLDCRPSIDWIPLLATALRVKPIEIMAALEVDGL